MHMDDYSYLLKCPGAIGVLNGGIYTFSGIGMADGIDSSLFEIGSLTKLFTGDIISELIDSREINIDDSLASYLDLPQRHKWPTLRDVLTHHAGYEKDYFEWIPVYKCKLGIDKIIEYRESIMRQRLIKENSLRCSGQYKYSNFGYAIIGMVASRVYGWPYSHVLEQHLKKNGYKHTGINIASDPDYWEWNLQDTYIAAGGLCSNVFDMLHFAKSVMSRYCDGKVSILTNLQSVITDGRQDDISGVGMSILIRFNETRIHTGCTARCNSYISFNPNTQQALAVFLKAPKEQCDASYIGSQLEKSVYY